MSPLQLYGYASILSLLTLLLCSCATVPPHQNQSNAIAATTPAVNYSSRLPQHIDTQNQKVVLVDPNVHAWGAYGPDGNLIRAGLATAGSNWCPDLGRPCHTKTGVFRVASLGSINCKSSIYPKPHGGAPMPYCMFFNQNQGLHGSGQVVEGNISHGCVRMRVSDAEWLRFNFVNIGTKVIVKPYY